MTTFLVTRHPGAIDWARRNAVQFNVHLEHLPDLAQLKKGDCVVGTLPVNLVYQLNLIGVRYLHLALDIPQHLRGIELTAEQLDACQAQLVEFCVSKVSSDTLC